MSAFDVKEMSETDAFRLETALQEDVRAIEPDSPQAEPAQLSSTDLENSAVAQVLNDVLAHWVEADEASAARFAAESGDAQLEHKISGLSELNAQPQGITGDFKADSAGPEEGMDTPPKLGGGEFGGGGGDGGGGDAGADWEEADTAAAEVEAQATAEADERGFDPSGGDGEDDEDDEPDDKGKPPPGKNKPKK
jgi:hypothetical protein